MEKVAPGGYAGKILRVNLTEGNISSEVLDERTARRYLGGAGFIAYYLWKELKQGAPGWIGFSKGLARRLMPRDSQCNMHRDPLSCDFYDGSFFRI